MIEKIDKKEYKANQVNTEGKKLEPWKNKSLKTSVNLMSMLEAFGKKLYDSKISALRETVVNHISHGAWAAIKKGEDAHVEIWFDSEKRSIVIRDFNGMGIPFDDMEKNCTELGGSGNNDRSIPGQHGYGFFAWLAIANFCTVETWSRITDEHYCYVGREGKIWEPSDERTLDSYGTKTTMIVDEDVNFEILEDQCHEFIEHFPVIIKIHHSSGDEVEYGHLTYDNAFANSRILENDNVMLVIDQTSETPNLYRRGRGKEQSFFINNVPIDVAMNGLKTKDGYREGVLDSFKFNCNIKNESIVVPPIQRDKLNKDDSDKIYKICDNLIRQEFKKHVCDNIDDFLSIDDKWIWKKSHKIREMFSDKTRDFYTEMDHKMNVNSCDSTHNCNKPGKKKAGEYIKLGDALLNYDNLFLEYQNGRKDRLIIGANLPKSACLSAYSDRTEHVSRGWMYKNFKEVKAVIKENKFKLNSMSSESIMVYCNTTTKMKSSINVNDIKKSDFILNIPLGEKSRSSWFDGLGRVNNINCRRDGNLPENEIPFVGKFESGEPVPGSHRLPLNIAFSRKHAKLLHDNDNCLRIANIMKKLQTITTFVSDLPNLNNEGDIDYKEPTILEMSLFDAIPYMVKQSKILNDWAVDNDMSMPDRMRVYGGDARQMNFVFDIEYATQYNVFSVPNIEDRKWIKIGFLLWIQYHKWCCNEDQLARPGLDKENMYHQTGSQDHPTLKAWIDTLDFDDAQSDDDYREWVDWEKLANENISEHDLPNVMLSIKAQSDNQLCGMAYRTITHGPQSLTCKNEGSFVTRMLGSDVGIQTQAEYNIWRDTLKRVNPKLHRAITHLFVDANDEDISDGNLWNNGDKEFVSGEYCKTTGMYRDLGILQDDSDRDDVKTLNRLVCSFSELLYTSTYDVLNFKDNRIRRTFGLGNGWDCHNDSNRKFGDDKFIPQHTNWINSSRLGYSVEDAKLEKWSDENSDVVFPVTVGNEQKRSTVEKMDSGKNPLFTDMWQTCVVFDLEDVPIGASSNNFSKDQETIWLVDRLRKTNPEFFTKSALNCKVEKIVFRKDVELFKTKFFSERKVGFIKRIAPVKLLIEYINLEHVNMIKSSIMMFVDETKLETKVKYKIDSNSITAIGAIDWAWYMYKKNSSIVRTNPTSIDINGDELKITFTQPEKTEFPPILISN